MVEGILAGDCLKILPTLPANSVDLVLADPPYGITQNSWDSEIPLNKLWPELWRVCRGAVVLTASQPFTSTLVVSQLKHFKHEWIWEKNKASGHLNAKKMPMRAHESVLVFAQKAPTYRPQMTTGHKPGNYAMRRTYTPNYGAQRPTEYGGQTVRYPRSVQSFDIINNDDPNKEHPTQKPVDLFRYFIRTYSNPGDIVLDFSAGSGTTAVAAAIEGRRFVCIEREPKYVEIAQRRAAEANRITEMLS